MGSICGPRSNFHFDVGDRPATKLPDGPVPCGRCELCKEFFDDDIYLLRGVTLCGDCRYFVRNGRWPNYDRGVSGNASAGGLAIANSEKRYHGNRYYSGE